MSFLELLFPSLFKPVQNGDSLLQRLFPSLFPPNAVVQQQQSIETVAYNLANTRIQQSEGYRLDVYLDSRGLLSVGIGHLVVPADNLKLGNIIKPDRLNQFFAKDIAIAFNAGKSQAKELNKYEPDMIAALTEVNFQLGTGWRSKFPNTWSALKTGNWQKAINNLRQSAWFSQTPNRVTAFINTITNIYT